MDNNKKSRPLTMADLLLETDNSTTSNYDKVRIEKRQVNYGDRKRIKP